MTRFALQFGNTQSGLTYLERMSAYGICARGEANIAIAQIGKKAPYEYDLPGGGVEADEDEEEGGHQEAGVDAARDGGRGIGVRGDGHGAFSLVVGGLAGVRMRLGGPRTRTSSGRVSPERLSWTLRWTVMPGA